MLTIFKDENIPFQMMQNQWSSKLEPLLAVPINSGRQISVKLVSGTNVINHGLGSKLQGWFIVGRSQWLNGGTPTSYDVTDTQSSNSMPALTLQLYSTQGTASNPVLLDLWVY